MSYNISEGSKFDNDKVRDEFKDRYLELKEKVYFDSLINLLREYIMCAVPNFLASEFNYWNITCLPKYLKESGCIIRININTVPVLSVFEESNETLTFMLYASKLPYLMDLKKSDSSYKSNFKDIPSLRFSIRDGYLEKTEGDEINFIINQKDFYNVLKHKTILFSIRLFNLRMMNKIGEEEKYRRRVSHCLDLSDKILEKLIM